MMFSTIIKGTSAITLLPGKKNLVARFFRSRNKRNDVLLKIVKNIIAPELAPSFSDSEENRSDTYPWCFILPVGVIHSKLFCVGALILNKNIEKADSIFLSYSLVSYQQLVEECHHQYNLVFWQARILAGIADGDIDNNRSSNIRQWIKSLQRSYSWFERFVKKQNQFHTRANVLLMECCAMDYVTHRNSGVEQMPWAEWPMCITKGEYVWLWRQNMYGRILASKRINIANGKPGSIPDTLKN